MFLKKFIALFVTLSLTLCAVLMSGQILFAKANTVDEQDTVFLEFVREDTGLQQIDYVSTQLFDEELTPNGRQYVFTVGGVQGYALTSKVFVGEQAFYEVEELYYNAPAPFADYQGAPVYITFKTYLDCVNGVFYDLSNNRAVVSQELIDQLAYKGFGYMGNPSGDYTSTTEYVDYSTKTTDAYSFPYDAPDVIGSYNGSNCANNAGACIITYYDRFFENLIPNYQSYTLFLGQIVYNDFSVEIDALKDTLKNYMAVDGVTQGTTFSGFQQGMERYVEEKGYTYSTSSVMSWGELDLQDYKQIVQQETPVALFLNGFTMSSMAENSQQDTVANYSYVATHVEVGIGYKCITYYNSNGGVIATRNFLKVASGILMHGIGYLNISSNASGEIVNAIAIDIY